MTIKETAYMLKQVNSPLAQLIAVVVEEGSKSFPPLTEEEKALIKYDRKNIPKVYNQITNSYQHNPLETWNKKDVSVEVPLNS